jgi:hypothetical protein
MNSSKEEQNIKRGIKEPDRKRELNPNDKETNNESKKA